MPFQLPELRLLQQGERKEKEKEGNIFLTGELGAPGADLPFALQALSKPQSPLGLGRGSRSFSTCLCFLFHLLWGRDDLNFDSSQRNLP